MNQAPNFKELLELIQQAGIDPKTGLPYRCVSDTALKESIKKSFRIVDESNAVNRYVWHNCPPGFDSQMLERILYYKGSCILFFLPQMNKFYILPYTLAGNIDCYGRFMQVTPVPFAGGKTDKDGKPKPWIPGLVFDVEHDIVLNWNKELLKNSCVIINDYTPQISQKIIPRSELQEPLLDMMAEILPFTKTALQNSTGVTGVRVPNEDDQVNVTMANNSIKNAALTGQSLVPILGKLDFQNLTTTNTTHSEEFLLTLQALDNLRLSHLGLSNGGLFQKKSHMLEAEQQMNQGNASLVLQDGLTQRQHACDIFNSITGLGLWVEPAETTIGADTNMDGQLVTNTDQSVQSQSQMEVEDDE